MAAESEPAYKSTLVLYTNQVAVACAHERDAVAADSLVGYAHDRWVPEGPHAPQYDMGGKGVNPFPVPGDPSARPRVRPSPRRPWAMGGHGPRAARWLPGAVGA